MLKKNLTDVLIELHVPDFKTVLEFYGKMGFKVVRQKPQEEGKKSGYLVINREQSTLCFFCGNEEVYNHGYFKRYPKTTPRGYAVEIILTIFNKPIEDYYKELLKKIDNKYVVKPLDIRPWGTKDFRIVDPFGFYLCIREPSNILYK